MFKQSGEIYTPCGEIYTPCREIYTPCGEIYTPLWGNLYPLWYLANNPTLRSQGLSCPKALYKEMQRDLRYYTMVAIIPVIDSNDIERMVNEFFINAKSDHVTC